MIFILMALAQAGLISVEPHPEWAKEAFANAADDSYVKEYKTKKVKKVKYVAEYEDWKTLVFEPK